MAYGPDNLAQLERIAVREARNAAQGDIRRHVRARDDCRTAGASVMDFGTFFSTSTGSGKAP